MRYFIISLDTDAQMISKMSKNLTGKPIKELVNVKL